MSPRAVRRTRKSAAAAAKTAVKRPFVVHHLAPAHEVLTEPESLKVLAKLGTPIERLPKITLSDSGLQTDPKFAALKESGENLLGRLVRIRRPSATAGEAIAYRVVVGSAGGD
jgi:DNA-directed RNA polymerase subunit H (RpoH/RPB5)